MFGKIKNRLKDVFKKTEDVVDEGEEDLEAEIQVKGEVVEDKSVEKPHKEEKKESQEKKTKKKKEKEVIELEKNIEEKNDEISDNIEEYESEEEKKGFFSKIFKKKDNEEEKELEGLQNEMLEDSPEEEKEAIKKHEELDGAEVEENRKHLEERIETEEKLEKDALQSQTEDKEKKTDSEDKSSNFISKTFGKLKSKKISQDDFDKIWVELEIFLLEINVAYEIVEKIENKLREEIIDNSFDRFKLSEKIREVLVDEVKEILSGREADFIEDIKKIRKSGEVAKVLVLGVNGTGKTTTIAKVVNYLRKNGLSVVVAAADTFRAAAVEQLEEHSKKLDFKLIQHKGGSDPAAVAYDAVEHAKARNIDVVLIDTAGRMPNNSNLMMELQKVKRVSGSQMAIFIGDSISGNDLIDQIELFDKGVNIDGVVLTKVDTDERPGSVVTTAYSIDKPIYFLGIGQTYDDLAKFDAKHVSEKLFEIDE